MPSLRRNGVNEYARPTTTMTSGNERLERFADDVWIASAPFRFLGLVHIGTRMTVLRLANGDLVVHSPVAIDAALKAEVDAHGTVHVIVAPNLYHHVYTSTAVDAWPDARLVAPSKLRKKRADLRIDANLEDGLAPLGVSSDEIELLPIEGTMLSETALLHRASGTLVAADLLENFQSMDHTLTRAYLKLGGVYGKPGWHRFLRMVYRDHAAARRSIEAILERPIERIVIAHGEPISSAPKDALREGLSFLFH